VKLSVNVGSFALEGYGFKRHVELASKLGFQAVELWIDRKNLWPLKLKKPLRQRALQVIKSYGLTVTSLCPIPFSAKKWEEFGFEFNLADQDPGRRRMAVKFYNSALDLASNLGAKAIIVLPGKMEEPNLMKSKASFRNYFERAVESLKDCSRHAEGVGVCLGVENAVVGNFIDRPEEMASIVDEVSSEYVKAYLDISNANVFFPPTRYIETLRGRLLGCIHVSDNDGTYAWHLPIGMGKIDYRGVIQKLKEIHWDGYLVPEIFYSKDPVKGVRDSKVKLEGLIKELGV